MRRRPLVAFFLITFSITWATQILGLLLARRTDLSLLNEDNLPGAQGVRTVRHHSQGVFEVVKARDGLRAVSQALRHPLVPDALGFVDPPGGAKGILLADFAKSIRESVARQGARREVQ